MGGEARRPRRAVRAAGAEFDLVRSLARATRVARSDVRMGIGDDAALVRVPPRSELVLAVDTLVAGVHFPRSAAAFDIGWKALAVNLSDLAAMGARPAWATLALTLPRADGTWVAAFARGFARLARQHGVSLVGGDTTRGPLTVTVQAHGFLPRDGGLLRSGARVGDVILISGCLGDAAAGLRLAMQGPKSPAAAGRMPAAQRTLLQRLNRPQPRVALGLALRPLAHAAIDVSDGLAQDLTHVLRASGVGAVLQADQLPASGALRRYRPLPQQRWPLQLAGGDDYELCFTLPPQRLRRALQAARRIGVALTPIGRVVAGRGLQVHDPAGKAVVVSRPGFTHFA